MNTGRMKMEIQLKSGKWKEESGHVPAFPFRLSHFQFRPAFTLTELLVVIAIIAILASLITAAAVNAMNAAKRTAITTEIRQLGDAIERFKTNLGGAYPPNVYRQADLNDNQEKKTNAQNLVRFLTKARPQSTELATNLANAVPQRNSMPNRGVDNIFPLYDLGIRPSEALVLWLSGFSGDTKRPFSGADLEVSTIHDDKTDTDIPNVITFESFDAPLYEFDKTRLRFSRNPDGSRRYLEVYGADGTGPAELQLYEYFPKGSEQPYIYFNTVDTPETVARTWNTIEFYYEDPEDSNQVIFPLKRLKPNSPTGTRTVANLEYVNQGKYQIFHPGLDDAWGNFDGTNASAKLDVVTANPDVTQLLLFPTGPFTGDLADTLSNFADGTLENEQE